MKRITLAWYRCAAIFILALPLQVLAAGPPKKQDMDNPIVQVFVLVIGILAVCIVLLANVLSGAAQYKVKKALQKKITIADGSTKIIGVLILLFISSAIFAADAPTEVSAAKEETLGGLSVATFYGLLSVVLVELFILLTLLYNLKVLLRKESAVLYPAVEEKKIDWAKQWDKFNSFRPVKEEAQIDLGHDYDGIRELDNRLPPWWLYGFYACIVFAVIYLWRFEVTHTAPSSLDEYNMAMKQGEEDKEAYLKKAANKVDENTVTLLKSESDIASGKNIFTAVCAACHANDGGGTVGPNLTDDYWLHGGSVKDIFKTIKYGWQEKGMKSWKDDYTPVQIAQLTSYIKSLRGKIPAKAKEAQGDLFIDEEKPARIDSVNQSTSPQSGATIPKTTNASL